MEHEIIVGTGTRPANSLVRRIWNNDLGMDPGPPCTGRRTLGHPPQLQGFHNRIACRTRPQQVQIPRSSDTLSPRRH